eukprot:TRINITY_DN3249_c0_g2_i2.p1 TRINITY_DN3249_c0_g2~~TRINITY_DN3249_c0_g2_i2.p1  ORF type:complete len:188 (-),score=12.75 TRINITY_DN3249_c0_g2_i2:576-1139(-)
MGSKMSDKVIKTSIFLAYAVENHVDLFEVQQGCDSQFRDFWGDTPKPYPKKKCSFEIYYKVESFLLGTRTLSCRDMKDGQTKCFINVCIFFFFQFVGDNRFNKLIIIFSFVVNWRETTFESIDQLQSRFSTNKKSNYTLEGFLYGLGSKQFVSQEFFFHNKDFNHYFRFFRQNFPLKDFQMVFFLFQ